jgi:hypothetical protein
VSDDYTPTGSVVPQWLIDDLIKQRAQPSTLYDLVQNLRPPPPDRRERARRAIAWRYYRLKSYLTHLGLALLNRCDREGYDW